jgi:PAS domain S-box-containing protein
MNNTNKTKDQLIAEVQDLHRRLAEAERSQLTFGSTAPTGESDSDEHLIARESITHNEPVDDSVLEFAAMLENILNKAADGICVFHNVEDSSKVRFTHWNPRMVQITGYTIDEINQFGWFQTMFLDPVIQQKALERMYRIQEGDQVIAEEWVLTSKEGNDVPVSVSTSVLKEENGRVHLLAFLQDISG